MSQAKPIPRAVLDAEAGVLGGCLLQPAILRDLDLETESFGHWPHRLAFQALRHLESEGRPIDVLSLEAQLEREGRLDAAGGVAALGTYVLHVPIPENVHEYARVIREAHVKRRVVAAADALIERAQSGQVSADELLGQATAALGKIDGGKADPAETIADLATRRFGDIERFAQEQAAGRRALSGVPTGIASLDAKTGGWQFGIVNLLTARPGMGKSAAAMATADACSRAGLGVHAFTLEDSWHAYADRQLSRDSGVPAIRIRRAEFKREEISELYGAMVKLRDRKNWQVDHRGGLSALELVRAVRRQQEKNQTRIAICDYIQLLRKRDGRMNETEHLGDCMQTFADSAKADDIAWLVLSQLNREVEKRNDKRPQLSDLRGSGELEEKCKLAVALYRGSYYGGKPKRDIDYECECVEAARGCAHAPSLEQWEQQVQVLILKGGNGPTGRVMANWSGETTRIW